ncbi:hypothetical protein BT63DRAFT_390706 [Microthyrium microscopicum]|uniref:Glycine cleavage system H protein n=1 Tax=Microthyrium microscopicum TaxID=703497 RepID=A0A6A6U803_9PEZI|nr:hypothetical protein BT63DRAFT_390706 [Microthyrium microscopicum]
MAARTSIMRGLRTLSSGSSFTTSRLTVRAVQPLRTSLVRPFSISRTLYERRYTDDHEWAELSADKKTCTVGITTYAANAIGDVTWIEMPEAGTAFEEGDPLAVIESTKAANDIYSPLSGTVTEVNAKLDEDPKTINADPEGDAWLVKLEVKDADEFKALLSKEDYDAVVAEEKKAEDK